MHNFANNLFFKLGKIVKQNEPLNTKCTFKIGGKSRFFVKINSLESLVYVLRVCKRQKLKWILVGGGSNVLFPQFFDGVVIDIKSLNKIETTGASVFASAGVMLPALCYHCKLKGLGGLEWAVSIPGTVGGAVKMNAGAFNNEFLDFVSAVYLLKKGRIVVKQVKKGDYGYRKNMFLKSNQVVLGVDLKLKKENPVFIEKRMNDFALKRAKSQNVGFPSAGSVFKKTKIGPASLLIDKAGLKGLRVGDASISTKHAGYIVNLGSATSADVLKLAKMVKKAVFKRFRQRLQFEICIV